MVRWSIAARHPQHVPFGAVDGAGEDEQQVGQPVQVGHGQGIHSAGAIRTGRRLGAVAVGRGPGRPFGAPGHGTRHVQLGRARRTPGQDERFQRRQVLRELVAPPFQPVDVRPGSPGDRDDRDRSRPAAWTGRPRRRTARSGWCAAPRRSRRAGRGWPGPRRSSSWPRRRPRTPRPEDRSCWSRTCPPAGSARRPRCAYRCESAEPRSHPNEGRDTPGHRVRPAAGSAVAQLTGDASPRRLVMFAVLATVLVAGCGTVPPTPSGSTAGAAGEHVERVGDRGCVAGRRGRLRVRGHRAGRPAGQPAAHHRRADHGLGEVRAGR